VGLFFIGMKKKYLIIVLILLFLFVVIITNRNKREYSYFNQTEFYIENTIINLTDFNYLDTIIHNALNHYNITGQIVVVRLLDEKIKTLFSIPPDIIYEGFIIYHRPNKYTIFTSGDNRLKNIDIIAHEVVHLKQYYENRLILDSFSKNYISFNGVVYDLDKIDYFDRPWEKEAFSQQKVLFDTLMNVLY
jgi:hypothetical protein